MLVSRFTNESDSLVSRLGAMTDQKASHEVGVKARTRLLSLVEEGPELSLESGCAYKRVRTALEIQPRTMAHKKWYHVGGLERSTAFS